ncbi:hypothetical protein C8J57DRAFT_1320315 [Mycena rebaudengoi]|nr:hypothetical protein C8J57DRAFT_1320315 [Mycena rebaudengoi]
MKVRSCVDGRALVLALCAVVDMDGSLGKYVQGRVARAREDQQIRSRHRRSGIGLGCGVSWFEIPQGGGGTYAGCAPPILTAWCAHLF